MEKCICKICCTEMLAKKIQYTMMWECPNCGYNITTSYVPHFEYFDVNIYNNSQINNNIIKELSVFLNLNYIQTKKRWCENDFIALKSLNENDKDELIKILSKNNIAYTVTKHVYD